MGFLLNRVTWFHREAIIKLTMKYSSTFKTREIAHKIGFAVAPKSMPKNVTTSGGQKTKFNFSRNARTGG
jgi:hypothetical protein